MIWVSVEGERIKIGEFSPRWLMERLERGRDRRRPVCVRVEIDEGPVQLGLPTPGCNSGGGGGTPNREELRIIEEWRRRGLAQSGWEPGQLIAFLKDLRRLL